MAFALNSTHIQAFQGRSAVEQAPALRAMQLGWIIIALSVPCAAAIVWTSGLSLVLGKMLPLLLMLPLLFGAYITYRLYKPDQRISDSAGALAMMASAAVLSGLISHAALRLQMPLIDPFLARADAWLGSGIGDANVVTLFFGLDGFNWVLELAYKSSVPLCLAAMLLCAARKDRKTAWEAASSFAVAILLCTVISVFIPAVGNIPHAGLTSAAAEGLPRAAGVFHMELWNALRNGPSNTLDLGQMDGVVTFPSFHFIMALIFARTAATLPFCKAAGYVWAVLIGLSTIPIGGHYIVDLIAGAALWLAIIGCFNASKHKVAQHIF